MNDFNTYREMINSVMLETCRSESQDQDQDQFWPRARALALALQTCPRTGTGQNGNIYIVKTNGAKATKKAFLSSFVSNWIYVQFKGESF